MSKEKYTIQRSDIRIIKDNAMQRFHDRKGFDDLSAEEIQVLLIIEGLTSFLHSKGIDPEFDVKFDPYKIGE